MASSRDRFIQEILEFMAVIHECYSGTSYANDRHVYAQDLVEAMGWIVDLRAGKSPEIVASEIKSPKTDKHFCDYWRQGSWGDVEAAALKKLQRSL